MHCNDGKCSSFTATEGKSGNQSSWSVPVEPTQPFPTSKRILCVRLRRWPIDRFRRQSERQRRDKAGGADIPVCLSPQSLVLVHTIASRQVITVASDEAAVAGARTGMSLAEARALCPGLQHADHDPDRDAKALVALARWLVRFTPAVMIDESILHPPSSILSAPQRHAIYLDLTGSERVFGGLGPLLRQLTAALQRLCLNFRVAVAPTIGAAWALSFSPDSHRRTFDDRDLPIDLPPLPVATLRLDPDAVATLHHLGLETIAQLLKLPRGSLPARFGDEILRRLDQAFGRAFEPFIPLAHHQPVEAMIDFDGIVQSPEALWEAFHQLLARLVADLTRRGCGAKQIEATFVRPDTAPLQKTIHLSAPTRDPIMIFNLLRCALDTLVPTHKRNRRPRIRMTVAPIPAAPITPTREQFHPEGFTALQLRVTHFERMTDAQSTLHNHEAESVHRELARLIERLRARLGEDVLAQPHLAESHLPELGYRRSGIDASSPNTRHPIPGTRPLNLLPTPTEIRVMVSPSHDRDGRPISFVTPDGHVQPVDHAIGPERIAGHWWSGRHKTRDYFDAATPTGRRFWLFRVAETSKWYLHGAFE